MIKIYKDEFKYLSFSDSIIFDMEIDLTHKNMKILLDGAYWHKPPEKIFDKGFMTFTDWEDISNDYWDGEQWISCSNPLGEPLQDLLEFEYENGIITMESFAKNIPGWIRWKIINPKCYAEFEESELEYWGHKYKEYLKELYGDKSKDTGV